MKLHKAKNYIKCQNEEDPPKWLRILSEKSGHTAINHAAAGLSFRMCRTSSRTMRNHDGLRDILLHKRAGILLSPI